MNVKFLSQVTRGHPLGDNVIDMAQARRKLDKKSVKRPKKAAEPDRVKYPEFGRRLTVAREAKGKSKKDFAAELGFPYQTYRNWEAGNRKPHEIAKYVRLAEKGISVNFLFTGKGPMLIPDDGNPEPKSD